MNGVTENQNKKVFIVYMAKNTITNKIYIGKTSEGLTKRITRHSYNAFHGSNYVFHRAIKKYGLESFVFTVLFVCRDEQDLSEKEKNTICELNSKIPFGYNMTDGGDGLSGLIRTATHNKKIGDANRGRKQSIEEIERKRRVLTGRKLTEDHKEKIKKHHSSPEFKEKMAKVHTGTKHTQEHIEKIRIAHIGIKHSDETKSKIKEYLNRDEIFKKMSSIRKGHRFSEEHKNKISLSLIRYNNLKREKENSQHGTY